MEINQAIWASVLSERIWFKRPSTGLKISDSVMGLILRTREKGELNKNHFYTYWSERFPVRCIVPAGKDGLEDGYFPEEVDLYFPGVLESIVSLRLLDKTKDFASISVREAPITYGSLLEERIHRVTTLMNVDAVQSAIGRTISMYFEANYAGWTQPQPNTLWVPPTPEPTPASE
jgi:hypothetical protein